MRAKTTASLPTASFARSRRASSGSASTAWTSISRTSSIRRRCTPSLSVRIERLVEEGTVGAYGVSNFDAAQLEEALAAGRPSLVQNSYSLLERGDEDGVLPLCADHGLDYQAFSPLAGGWLTGKYRPRRGASRGLAHDAPAGPVRTSRRGARPQRSRTPQRARRSGDARARLIHTPRFRRRSLAHAAPSTSRRPSQRATSTCPLASATRSRHSSPMGDAMRSSTAGRELVRLGRRGGRLPMPASVSGWLGEAQARRRAAPPLAAGPERPRRARSRIRTREIVVSPI